MTRILVRQPAMKSGYAGWQDPIHQATSASLVHEGSAGRMELEAVIAGKFAREYNARISHFLPYFLCLSVSGKPGAVVGVQPAHEGALFLEQYVDLPIEQATAGVFQTPVDRDEIVEIGNLSATTPGGSYSLFAVLAKVLQQSGYRWVVCTATPQVVAMLAKMNFSSRRICQATAACMGESVDAWGDYYTSHPSVIVGDIGMAAAQVSEDRDLSALTRLLSTSINDMAARLRKTTR